MQAFYETAVWLIFLYLPSLLFFFTNNNKADDCYHRLWNLINRRARNRISKLPVYNLLIYKELQYRRPSIVNCMKNRCLSWQSLPL